MIRLHDTMARKKRDFEPADPSRITMYVCGPTVYGRAHIGNMRPPVVFDTLARLIRHHYGEDSLVYARNVTDIDDKIIAKVADEGVEPSLITERYEQFYLDDTGALGVAPPSIAPHATEEVPAMIAMIEELIGKGNAYEAEGHVLFSVPSDPDYGALSRRQRDEMIAGARVEVAPYKRDPADFVLWKPSDPDVIGFDSPWGRGRPGWHIECSAMIRAHLGETIDIHGGGLDLIFPHHENEIAQSRCSHGGAPLARYWVHNGFVDMGSQKMSKSLGNIVTPEALFAAGHKGETIRMALLSAHYRQPLPWTETLLEQAKATLDGLYRKIGDAAPGEVDASVLDALGDDLNTPLALSRLGQIEDAATLKASAALLGLLEGSADDWFRGGRDDDAAAIDTKIAERAAAKKARDFATADRIRDELAADGILLEDGPEGTTWRRG
ncbi:cysteine--tRNA ligase [Sphingomicrobium sediminis]|uniref:Cysteine--tRNA ligase n=1 Tax=Sphingomicrobium sediminis TaxID=2950949 RepID=A0A9X2EJE2_9SPHN|nr:cysteine--tRNA ligase [Sphingomicrobium sediminis]MCM8556367.1 cysteine--tRNA ligase [Sphingomicrobium sediminis]